MKLFAVVPLLAATVFPSMPAAKTVASPVTVRSVNHGVKLTLLLPRRTYPWNALVKVGIHLENQSNRTVWVKGVGNRFPGIEEPQPEVRDRRGRLLFPPAFPYLYPLPGPFPNPLALGPKQVMTRNDYVILRAPYLRVVAHLAFNRTFRQSLFQVVTPRVVLKLQSLPGPAYQVDFHQPPERLSATVTPVIAKPNGRFLHIEYSDCDSTDAWTVITWTPGGRYFEPNCSQPHEWHVIAGYVNQPVVTIDWKQH